MLLSGLDPFQALDKLPAPCFRTDIREETDAYVLEAELPGFHREDIRAELEGDCLTISAHRETAGENAAGSHYLRQERTVGDYSRTFALSGVDSEKICGHFHDGVLTLTLPRRAAEPPKHRHIEIQ